MRIALFRELPIDFHGGVTNVLKHILSHLKKNGHEAIVFAPDSQLRVRRFLGARLIGVPSLEFLKKKNFHFPYSNDKYLDKIFSRFKPDLIHLLHPMSLSWAAYTSAKRNRIPVLASYHTNYHIYVQFYKFNFLSKFVWNYTRWLFNKSHKVLSPSQTVKEMLDKGGIEQVDVWTRGVDSNLYSPSKRNEETRRLLTGGNPDETVFLFVGRLYKEKNVHFLADQWLRMGNKRLVFTGDGPEREALEKKLDGKNVLFTGHKTGEELASIYASADTLIFPSTTEGYPNVVMEAVSSGLPVIGADSFGVTDIIDESQAGLLFPANNALAFQSHVETLEKDIALRNKYAKRAREFGETKSWDNLMTELFNHYKEIIKESHRENKLKTVEAIPESA